MKRGFAGLFGVAVVALSMMTAGVAAYAQQKIVLGASVQLTGPIANTGRYYRDA